MGVKTTEYRLRQAEFVTIDSEYCSSQREFKTNPDTIFCAHANFKNEQTTTNGDSGNTDSFRIVILILGHQIEIVTFPGGPILSKRDGNLMGVTSLSVPFRDEPVFRVNIQVFTNVPYFYGWIEHITGLELPKCTGPQAPFP